MGWMSELCKTYDNNLDKVCVTGDDGKMPLLPLSHSVQRAHIEITISENGDFIGADFINAEEAETIIPVTEDSASRSSGIAPHMLHDKLIYVAGDCCSYIKEEKLRKKAKECFECYIEQLKEWCESDSCVKDVEIIYEYLQKRKVISDLVDANVIFLDENNRLSDEWEGDKKNKPLDIVSTFVRFVVKYRGCPPINVNENLALFKAFNEYYIGKKTDRKECYITGKVMPITLKHQAKLRGGGDGAKLISSNDKQNFTYRGRFDKAEDCLSISYEASQKAHNALRWLIDKYGWRNADQVIVAWGVDNGKYPQIKCDTYDLFGIKAESLDRSNIDLEYSEQLKKALNGYKHENIDKEDYVVMVLESATPGRLSLTYYSEMKGSDFLKRIEEWHSHCCWIHEYRFEKNDGNVKIIPFIGAPSPSDIVFAAYGDKADEKLRKKTVSRILSCILNGRGSVLPRDIAISAFRRAIKHGGISDWEIKKTTSIACALIKYYRYISKKEEWSMGLDKECRDRSYMFGRALAYADEIERFAQYVSGGERRTTNARKLSDRFVTHPGRTMMNLKAKLEPYIDKLYANGNKLFEEMNVEVISKISVEDFSSKEPLNELFLLGYACQLAEFRKRKKENADKTITED